MFYKCTFFVLVFFSTKYIYRCVDLEILHFTFILFCVWIAVEEREQQMFTKDFRFLCVTLYCRGQKQPKQNTRKLNWEKEEKTNTQKHSNRNVCLFVLKYNAKNVLPATNRCKKTYTYIWCTIIYHTHTNTPHNYIQI